MGVPGFAESGVFLTVLEQKSFTKAAKRHGLSPARVSDIVRRMEDMLGVRLIERTTRSVAPTAAGERLSERLRIVLADYEAALDSIKELGGRPAGALRLNVAPPAADLVMAPALPRFLARYPEISVEIVEDSGLTDIVAGRFDAGIRPGVRLARDMIAVRISERMPMVVVGAPSYFAASGRPRGPQDLASHECIRFRLSNGTLFPWSFRIKQKRTEVQVQGRLIAQGMEVAKAAVRDGAAIFQVPLPYVANDLAEGRLERVLDDWADTPIDGFFLYYPASRQPRPALKALMQFLRTTHTSSPASRTGNVSKGARSR
ncbi:LysR family transcriptional regulator [Bradyrhizobium sp. Pha-3]|uniref:LysR family transcriptional regulator n=1 Tax=Bradyrhizobium sp. Pha-3 TaxID=208375 RepID=UPI0035D52473